MPWAILASIFMLAFAMWSPMFCVPPMELVLKSGLSLTHAQTSLLYTVPVLMMAAIAIPCGFVADRIGAKKAAGIGAIIIALGAVLRGTATSFHGLLAFTFVYGVGVGWCFPSLPKVVSSWVPRDRIVTATGTYTAGIMAGTATALAITMPVVYRVAGNVQGVFFIWGIVPIVAATMWWLLVKEPPHDSIHVESTGKSKTSFKHLLKNRNLWLICVMFFLSEFFIYTWSGWAPVLLAQKGATPTLAGLFSSITQWVAIPISLFMPRLIYRVGKRKPFIWLPSVVIALVSWWAISVKVSLSWLPMVIVGMANTTRFITILALPVEMLPREEVGRAGGLLIAIGYTGGVIGPLIGGHILDIAGSLNLSLFMLTIVSVVEALVVIALTEIKSGLHHN